MKQFLISYSYKRQLVKSVIVSISLMLLLGCNLSSPDPVVDTEGNVVDTSFGFIKSYGSFDFDDNSAVTKPLRDGTFVTAGQIDDGTPWIGKMDAEGNLYDQFTLLPTIDLTKPYRNDVALVAKDGRELILLRRGPNDFLKLQLRDANSQVLWTKVYPYEAIRGITEDYDTTESDRADYSFFMNRNERFQHQNNLTPEANILLVTPIDANGTDGNSFYMVMHRAINNHLIRNLSNTTGSRPQIYAEDIFWVQRVSTQTGEIIWKSRLYRSKDFSMKELEESNGTGRHFSDVGFDFNYNYHGFVIPKIRYSASANGYNNLQLVAEPNSTTPPHNSLGLDIDFDASGGVRIFSKQLVYKGTTNLVISRFSNHMPAGTYNYDIFTSNISYSATGLEQDTQFDSYSTSYVKQKDYHTGDGDGGPYFDHPELRPYKTNLGIKSIFPEFGQGFFDQHFNELNTGVWSGLVNSDSVVVNAFCDSNNLYSNTDCIWVYLEQGAASASLDDQYRLKILDLTGNELYSTTYPGGDTVARCFFGTESQYPGVGWIDGQNLICASANTSMEEVKFTLISASPKMDDEGYNYRKRSFLHTTNATQSNQILDFGLGWNGIRYNISADVLTQLRVNPTMVGVGVSDIASSIFVESVVNLSSGLKDETTRPFEALKQHDLEINYFTKNSFTVTDVAELDRGVLVAMLSPSHYSSSNILVALRDRQILWTKNLYEPLDKQNSKTGTPRRTVTQPVGVYRHDQAFAHSEARVVALEDNSLMVFLHGGILLKIDALTGDKIWERSWTDNRLLTDPLFDSIIFTRQRYNGQIGGDTSLKWLTSRGSPSFNTAIRNRHRENSYAYNGFKLLANNDVVVSMPTLKAVVSPDEEDPSKGTLNSFGYDFFIARIGNDGNEKWKKVFDLQELRESVPSYKSRLTCPPNSQVVEMPNGNILVGVKFDCGLGNRSAAAENRGDSNWTFKTSAIFLLLVDSEGNLITNKVLQSKISEVPTTEHLLELPYPLAINEYTRLPFVMDVNKEGKVWFGFTFHPDTTGTEQTIVRPDDSIVPLDSLMLMRLDENLKPELMRTYGGLESERLSDLRVLPDGGLLVTGKTRSISVTDDSWVLRLGEDGLIQNNCSALIDRSDFSEAASRYFVTRTIPVLTNNEQATAKTVLNKDQETREFHDVNDRLFEVIPSAGKIETARSCAGPTLKLPLIFGERKSLTITPPVAGTITDNSRPQLIECQKDELIECLANYSADKEITLSVTADTGFVFTGWTNDCANIPSSTFDGSSIKLLMDSDKICGATFTIGTRPPVVTANLSVTKLGSGDGIITSDIQGIDCGSDCSETINIGSQIVLTATPDANSTFVSWTGTGDCRSPTILVDNSATITVSQDSECIATFDPILTGDFVLTVVINGGPGAGEVRSSESPMPLMQCLNSNEVSSTCTVAYPVDSGVTLITSLFSPNNTIHMTGCDTFVGSNLDCFINMDQDKTVTFDISESPAYDITASVTGNGSIISFGTGEGSTGYINCPTINCDDIFVIEPNAPNNITFEAHPDTGSTFVSWGVSQCDSEQILSGIGICVVSLVPGSPTFRQIDATFQ